VSRRPKRRTPVRSITAEEWRDLGSWLRDRIDELEPDAVSVEEEQGPHFLDNLKRLAIELEARAEESDISEDTDSVEAYEPDDEDAGEID